MARLMLEMKTYKYDGAFVQAYVKGMLHAGLLVGAGLLAGLLALMVW
jgi:hypothetical protein